VALKRKALLSAMRVLRIRAMPRILFVFWQRLQLRWQFLGCVDTLRSNMSTSLVVMAKERFRITPFS
jgi:hypothetical protein